MKAVLDFLTSKLTPVCVLLILAYIAYNEVFRPSQVNAKLNQALAETRQVQTQLQLVDSELKKTKTDLQAVIGTVNRVDAGLLDLSDSISVINGSYKAIKSILEQQSAVYQDRYNQEKKRLQAIQQQVK
ncbi:hypothetical protein [Spirosoma sp. 48-14]|uniref:hypothetical protein n=1 Tax=Spirosoma sp. 48-14 TaxID=1895854 RepID=UPI000959E00B|nr:hypothetical protein [Spirosoma sp. 48-14]OJW76295.1 MAG: hypothetical protein BGO59_22515 [Spirosoma sp. 48-14]